VAIHVNRNRCERWLLSEGTPLSSTT
jgi:hypothetical protein